MDKMIDEKVDIYTQEVADCVDVEYERTMKIDTHTLQG